MFGGAGPLVWRLTCTACGVSVPWQLMHALACYVQGHVELLDKSSIQKAITFKVRLVAGDGRSTTVLGGWTAVGFSGWCPPPGVTAAAASCRVIRGEAEGQLVAKADQPGVIRRGADGAMTAQACPCITGDWRGSRQDLVTLGRRLGVTSAEFPQQKAYSTT